MRHCLKATISAQRAEKNGELLSMIPRQKPFFFFFKDLKKSLTIRQNTTKVKGPMKNFKEICNILQDDKDYLLRLKGFMKKRLNIIPQ